MRISKYLTDADAIKSETAIRQGIDNSMNGNYIPDGTGLKTAHFVKVAHIKKN